MNIRTLLKLKACAGAAPEPGNLFDEATAPTYTKYLAFASGSATECDWMDTDGGMTYSMKAKANTTYTVTAGNPSVSILRVAAITTDPADAGHDTIHCTNAKNTPIGMTMDFTTGSGEKWLIIQVNRTYIENRNAKITVEYKK